MITDGGLSVTFERLSQWPALKGVDVSGVSVCVLEAGRGVTPTSALNAVSNECVRIGSALNEGFGFALLVLSPKARDSSAVVKRLLRQRKAWGALEAKDVPLPKGFRQDLLLDDEGPRYLGVLSFEQDQLPLALEMARSELAACLIHSQQLGHKDLLNAFRLVQQRMDIPKACVQLVKAGHVAINITGHFGDPVTADIFYDVRLGLQGLYQRKR